MTHELGSTRARRARVRAAALGALLALSPAALARAVQDGPTPAPPGPPPQGSAADEIEEMKRLFREVEAALERIDLHLSDAGAGEAPLEEVEGSGIEKLLRSAQSEASEAIGNIDKILEIAQSLDPKGGSGSRSQPSGESPLDSKRPGGPLDRESTPEEPGGASNPPQPQPGQGLEPHRDPPSPEPDEPGGRNRPGEDPPGDPGSGVPHEQDSDPWGFLPERAREVFRNQGGTDLPVHYRDWIDSYYRRLNNAPRR